MACLKRHRSQRKHCHSFDFSNQHSPNSIFFIIFNCMKLNEKERRNLDFAVLPCWNLFLKNLVVLNNFLWFVRFSSKRSLTLDVTKAKKLNCDINLR